MDKPVVRSMIEEAAIKNNLSGDLKVIMSREYEEECFHYLTDFKDEIFENSDLSFCISKVLAHLPIAHNSEVYDTYTEEYPVEEAPGHYLWNVEGKVLSLEEINHKFVNNPLYDVDRQNASDVGEPVFDSDLLAKFLSENLYNMYNVISWDVHQYDHKRGNATVTASLTATIDQIMNLPDCVLTGWNYSMQTLLGELTIEG